MTDQSRVSLNDSNSIPQLGLGVWQVDPKTATQAVRAALQAGYRHVDTAAAYQNESGVGDGIRTSGIARDELFVTTKLWNDAQGFDQTLSAFDRSLDNLGLDYVDLYLVHWPAPKRGLYVDTWRALIRLRDEGRVRSIGVSNFAEEHLKRIIEETGVTPAINQIELHPRFQQRNLRAFHRSNGIATESWSPLGQGKLLSNATVADIGARHQRTPAQITIRWHLELGLVVIPKSVTLTRIVENFSVFDFYLTTEDKAALDALDDPRGRIGPDPVTAAF
jgi:2,5-diketo-D-gluconate reductase A